MSDTSNKNWSLVLNIIKTIATLLIGYFGGNGLQAVL